ncbi:MAG: hypothetical protein AB7K09_07185 [Planctomycetota bacterium]
MHDHPGATLLKVLLFAALVFFVGFNTWAINRLETQRGLHDSPGAAAPTSVGAGPVAPAARQLGDGTIVTNGVIVLPSGVVIVPQPNGTKVYSADGKLIADTSTPTPAREADPGNPGNTPDDHGSNDF